MSDRLKIALVTDMSVWPMIQVGLANGADIRVVNPYGKNIHVKNDSTGVKQYIEHLNESGDYGKVDIFCGASNFLPSLEWADVIYVDNTHISDRMLGVIAKTGKPAIHASALVNKLEYDRQLGDYFLSYHGFKTTAHESIRVDDVEDLSHTAKNEFEHPPVIKGKYLTLLPKTWTQFDSMVKLYRQEQRVNKKDYHIIIEENLSHKAICEFAFASYFNGEDFLPYVFYNVEYKDAFDNPMPSILTGESGTNLIIMKKENAPALFECLQRFKTSLKNLGYHGFFDLNCMLMSDNEIRVMEHTARPGFPTEAEIFKYMIDHNIPVVSLIKWITGLSDEIPNIPEGVQTALAISSILTNYADPNKNTQHMPVIFDNGFMADDEDFNQCILSLMPGNCNIDEDYNPLCVEFDRTAFLICSQTFTQLGIDTPSAIDEQDLAILDNSIKRMDDYLQQAAANTTAFAHIHSTSGSWKFSLQPLKIQHIDDHNLSGEKQDIVRIRLYENNNKMLPQAKQLIYLAAMQGRTDKFKRISKDRTIKYKVNSLGVPVKIKWVV